MNITLPAHLLAGLRARAGGSAAAMAAMFEPQLEFVRDPSPRKAALCSRRAGKSHGTSGWLLEGAERAPGGMSCYIGLSKSHARRVSWASFHKLERVFRLGLKFTEQDSQLMVVHPNGHRIWLAGCADASEVDKFRGATDGFHRVVVDEAQAFGSYLEELVDDALDPALLDNRGTLALTGTPSPVCAGYFHDITTGTNPAVRGWPTHHWTVLDNRSIPHAAEWLEEKRKSKGWQLDHPTYRREWLGEWVNDAGALVYPLSRALNHYLTLPDGDWTYALGVDLGFADATAFVVAATQRRSGQLYVIEAEKRSGMLPQAVAARIEQYRQRYRFSEIVVDEGGLGKGYAEQMRSDGIPCRAADKQTKRAAQEWLRGLILAGAVHVDWIKARALVDECSVLSWDENGREEDPRFDNHAADGFLYVARALLPLYRPEEEPPTVGSKEWDAKRRQEWRDAEIKARNKRAKRESPAELIARLNQR